MAREKLAARPEPANLVAQENLASQPEHANLVAKENLATRPETSNLVAPVKLAAPPVPANLVAPEKLAARPETSNLEAPVKLAARPEPANLVAQENLATQPDDEKVTIPELLKRLDLTKDKLINMKAKTYNLFFKSRKSMLSTNEIKQLKDWWRKQRRTQLNRIYQARHVARENERRREEEAGKKQALNELEKILAKIELARKRQMANRKHFKKKAPNKTEYRNCTYDEFIIQNQENFGGSGFESVP